MRIIVTLDGGLVDSVYTDAGEDVQVMIRDLDTEGLDEVAPECQGFCEAVVRMDEGLKLGSDSEFDMVWNHFKPKD